MLRTNLTAKFKESSPKPEIRTVIKDFVAKNSLCFKRRNLATSCSKIQVKPTKHILQVENKDMESNEKQKTKILSTTVVLGLFYTRMHLYVFFY
jgi:hypothetical protein